MKFFLLLSFFLTSIVQAQIPPGYYNSAQGITGNNLKIALHNIIDNHTVISYDALWNAYKKTDKKPNGKVWDMYSDNPGGNPPYEFTFFSDQCGSYNEESDCYNREHSWPQSWFNSESGPVSDIFHIYPTDGYVNNRRSSFPFGTVDSAYWTSANGSKLGLSTNPGYYSTVFEPIDEYKGDLARTYFYMSARYYSEDAGWNSSGGTNKSNLLPWLANVLLQWHHQDPVSAKEIARNDSIYYFYQDNRNPFIDHPEWADSIWQSTVIVFLQEIKNQHTITLYPNPAEDFLYLNFSEIGPTFFRVLNISGQFIMDGKLNDAQISISSLDTGFYFISFINTKGSWTRSFSKM